MGFLVFLIMLAFAMQVLLGLYVRSITSAAAFDAAQHLARHPGDAGGADQIVLGELGQRSVLAHRDVSTDPDFVEYEIRVRPPTFLTGDWWTGSSEITRKARVRVEKVRGTP